jgi:hypothetical protein
MATTPVTNGTTLEVLAPYLPYGIEIQVKTGWGGGLDVMTGTFAGLNPRERDPVKLEMFNQGGIKTFFSDWELANCLPILRPFSALTTPLPDGSIPAVEVAKRMVTRFGRETVDWTSATVYWNNGIACVDFRDGGELFIWPDLRGLEIEAIDYLRSKHFALSVNGCPLLEEIDFIAKESSALPTKEGESKQ